MLFDELLTLKQFHEKMLPKLQKKTVGCALCGKTFKRLTGAHLATHKGQLEPLTKMVPVKKTLEQLELEINEFPDKVPERWTTRPERLSEIYRRVRSGTDPLTALIDQTIRLYHPKRSEWLLMEHLPGKAEWTTVSLSSKGWPWYTNRLTADRLKEHFLGQITIGVHSHNALQSHVLVFDVDGYQQVGESGAQAEWRIKNITRILVRLLRRHGLEPHVVASGKKGYHVCLYFDVPLSITKAQRLFQYFMQHPELPTDGAVIECLPYSHAVKLPLGINWGAKSFCSYVEPFSLMPVPDPYRYFLGIQPMSTQKVLGAFKAEPNALAARPRKHTGERDRFSTSELATAFYDGIQARGTRHVRTLQAAAYCLQHEQPETLFDLMDKMLGWSKTQYERNRIHIKTPWYEHERELHRIVKYAWSHPLYAFVGYGVCFSTADVHWIRNKTNNLKSQRLLLAALYQSRLSGEEFHFGFERMRQLTELAKDSLALAIDELREKSEILQVVKNYSHQTGYFQAHTTSYRLSETPDKDVISTNLVRVDEASWSADLWNQLLKLVFGDQELRKLYPYSWHRIVQSPPIAHTLTA